MSLPVMALAAWIAAGFGAYRLRRDPDWFHLCAGLPQLVWSADKPHRAAGPGAGHSARGAGLLHCPFISLAGQRSAAAEIAPRRTLSPAGGLPRRPHDAVPLAPLFVAFTDSEALIHRVRAEPLGTYAHPGPGRKTGRCAPPSPGPRRSPASAKVPAQRRAGRPTRPAAPNSCGATPNVSNRRRRPAEQLAADLTNPFGPALAAALAAPARLGPDTDSD